MQNVGDFYDGPSARVTEEIGGEPLAGSGFEAEYPELGFSAVELKGQE
jgi:hypothetical protein